MVSPDLTVRNDTEVGTPPAQRGGDATSAYLTASDQEALSHIYGYYFPPGQPLPGVALMIENARRNGQLSPNQDVSAAFFDTLLKSQSATTDKTTKAMLIKARDVMTEGGKHVDVKA